jgi:hypothetical protein
VSLLNSVWSELIGLFVDDGRFAIAITLWLGACWLVLPHVQEPSTLPPVILFAGLIVILAESAIRLTRASLSKNR